MKHPITFDRYGFRSASAFVIKDERQIQVGFIDNIDLSGVPSFSYFGTYDQHLSHEEVPSPTEIVEAYVTQLEANGVSVNGKIGLAG